jgi:methionyl-tRNA synthetase
MDRFAIHEGAAAVYRLVDATNEFIAATEPWMLARDPERRDRLNQVLHEAAEAVRIAGVLLLPVIPQSAAEILRRMGETRPAADLALPDAVAWTTGRDRHVVKADALWPRIEAPTVAAAKPGTPERTEPSVTSDTPKPSPAPESAPTPIVPAPVSPTPAAPASGSTDARLSIDEFLKIQLRTARVLAAEPVPKSKKLLKLTIDVGDEQRTLVAGIAEAYEPESLVGRTIIVVANLKPAKLMGVESNGMLLAASPEGGKPMLLQVDGEVAPGTRIR